MLELSEAEIALIASRLAAGSKSVKVFEDIFESLYEKYGKKTDTQPNNSYSSAEIPTAGGS